MKPLSFFESNKYKMNSLAHLCHISKVTFFTQVIENYVFFSYPVNIFFQTCVYCNRVLILNSKPGEEDCKFK